MTSAVIETTDCALRQCVERVTQELHGDGAIVQSVDVEPCTLSASHDTAIVTVQFNGGAFRLFLKDDGHVTRHSNRIGDAPMQRSFRERRVYEKLLIHADLGTPHLYATYDDDAGQQHCLLLEFVAGEWLANCGIGIKRVAAAWLARLHAFFADLASRTTYRFLIHHDAAFFHHSAMIALDTVSQMSSSLSGRLYASIEQYERFLDFMTDQPPTLLHGALNRGSVLVAGSAQPLRICAVDWEGAALGSGIYDLASFCHHHEPKEKDLIVHAYQAEAALHGMHIPSTHEIHLLMRCFRIHELLCKLQKPRSTKYVESGLAKLSGQLEQIMNVS